MKIALITTGQEVLGIEYLSSVMKKKNHEVRLFFDPQPFGGGIFLKIKFLAKKFNLQEKIVKKIIEWQPDIVGFSCMTHNYHWCLKTATKIKSKFKVPIIFGGIHPTIMSESVLSNDCVDFVSIGESEKSFVKLLDRLRNDESLHGVEGIYSKIKDKIIENPPYPLIKELDNLPFPDHNIFYEKIDGFRKESYSIIASRGCPYACTYCCNDVLKKFHKFIRRIRSVNNVIAELKWAKAKFNISRVYFRDEVFPFQMEWLKEFCRRYKKEIKLPFTITNHFNFATEERLSLLSDAGCFEMIFGLQSASERVREDICNRFMTNQQVETAVNLCKKYKIQIIVEVILGLPSETREELEEAVNFYRKIKPDIIYTYWLTYLPKTSIIAKGIQYGNLKESDIEMINAGSNSFFHQSSFIKNKKMLLEYQTIFDLTTLLPRKIHRFISSKWLRKMLPRGYFFHFFLLMISSFKLKHSVFWAKLQPILSKKCVP